YGPPPSQPPRQPSPQSPPQPQPQFGAPTYHQAPTSDQASSAAGNDRAGIARAAFTQTNRAARVVTRKVISASKADGAHESGLTALIWNQVLSYGTDAMITVALAGSVFFGASTHAQRGNVLLYLLITMAPFALVAPVIGPLLDRLQHGRRWTMAGTAVLGGLVGLIINVTGSYSLGLFVTAVGFFACAVFAFKLPANVDSAAAAKRHPQEPPRPRLQQKVPPLVRLRAWAKRGFDEHIVL